MNDKEEGKEQVISLLIHLPLPFYRGVKGSFLLFPQVGLIFNLCLQAYKI